MLISLVSYLNHQMLEPVAFRTVYPYKVLDCEEIAMSGKWLLGVGTKVKGLGGVVLLLGLGLAARPAAAQTATIDQVSAYLREGQSTQQAQVTSVSEFADVKPTDWAFQALQSLVERYGCIAGYPTNPPTFKGDRALTRYEFAAGLNACLDRINELIAAATEPLATKEDLATVQKLQEQFAAELATLRGRVDSLEARTATLESQQFSTTTKLSGQAIFGVVAAGGGNTNAPARGDATTFNYRVRLNFQSSFTGQDALVTGLQAYDIGNYNAGLGVSDTPIFNDGVTNLGYTPGFAYIDPSDSNIYSPGSVQLYKLAYLFPAPGVKNMTVFVAPAVETTDAFPTVLPFYGEGSEAVSRWGQVNSILRLSTGTSGIGNAAAIGFTWSPIDWLNWTIAYASANPEQAGDSPSALLGAGLFGGSTVVMTQLTFTPFKNFQAALTYANAYHQINVLGTSLSNADIFSNLDSPITSPIRINGIGGTFSWEFLPNISLAGYGSYMLTETFTEGNYANLLSWMLGVHFKDPGLPGSAGLMFGSPLYRTAASQLTAPGSAGNDTPYQLEAYYRFQVNRFMSVTPGVFFVFNPEGNPSGWDAQTVTVGVVRTTFNF